MINEVSGAIIAVAILMHLTFLAALIWRRNDLADIVWGPGFMVAATGALTAQYYQAQDLRLGAREIILLICVSLWSLRLFFYLGVRNLKKPEDSRYSNWRQQWGKTWVWRSYLQVFVLQGVIMLIIASPIIFAISQAPQEIDWMVYLGTAVWVGGFFFEVVGDAQLKTFKSHPANKGKIMDQGLWSWSRHPNYFGEVTQWWGIFLMVAFLEGGWMTILSPLAITFLILKVSGVPMLEELMKNRVGYEEYVRKTSRFIPLPPKR